MHADVAAVAEVFFGVQMQGRVDRRLADARQLEGVVAVRGIEIVKAGVVDAGKAHVGRLNGRRGGETEDRAAEDAGELLEFHGEEPMG